MARGWGIPDICMRSRDVRLKRGGFSILDQLQDLSERRYQAPVEMVRLHAGLGDGWTPVGEILKGDPKYEEILKRMGFPP